MDQILHILPRAEAHGYKCAAPRELVLLKSDFLDLPVPKSSPPATITYLCFHNKYAMPLLVTTKQKHETEIAKRAMEACEQIANEMGAEVHDDLIQKLTIFSLYLDRLERAAHHPAEIESLLLKMRGDFQEMASSVRSISRQLMPVRMEGEAFQKSIELLCQNLERPGQGRVHFEATGVEVQLPTQIKIYLHRIIQELVHNAFKHSAAWHVWVRLMWAKEEVILEVEDDGTAFSTMKEQIEKLEKKHNTLKMRSQAIGATLSYHQGRKGLLGRVRFKI